MSSDHTKKIIEIAKATAKKYTFPNYDEDDIEQEAFIIGLEAMSRYDPDRPLENFLRVHIRNRLSNLRRDRYYRPDTGKAESIQRSKKKLLDASPLDDFSYAFSVLDKDNLENRELLEYIDVHLNPSYRADYMRFLDGQKLTKARRTKLFEQLKEIMVNYYGENGPSDL